MNVNVEVDNLYTRKLQDTFGISVDTKLYVELKKKSKSLEFEIYNYLNDSNCYVSPVRFNGNEVSDDKKESLSLSVGSKSSIARYLINCAKPSIKNNQENREKIKGEFESAIRKLKLDLDDIFRDKFNF